MSFLRPLLMLMMTLGLATATPAQTLRLLGDDPADDGHVDAALISQHDTWQPGTTVTVGLRLAMDDGWHTYWKNPGDAGMPTSLTWDLPNGWAAHGIDWPAPVYFETNGIGGYGYVGTVVLPVRIDVPAEAAEGEVTLKAKADWLECADICVAGSADLQLTGTVGNDEPQPVAEHAELFSVAEARQPEEIDSATSDQSRDPSVSLSLEIPGLDSSSLKDLSSRAYFFPDVADVVDMSARQDFVVIPSSSRELHEIDARRDASLIEDWRRGVSLLGSFKASPLRASPPERLTGVLVIEPSPDIESPEPPRVWRIDAPVRTP